MKARKKKNNEKAKDMRNSKRVRDVATYMYRKIKVREIEKYY